MLTYLLRKRMEYCSHTFVSLTVEQLYRKAMATMLRYVSEEAQAVYTSAASYLSVEEKVMLSVADYPFRPLPLENFPLYFFMAGCEATRSLSSDSMEWLFLACDGGASVLRQRSYVPDPVCSKIVPRRYLVDDENRSIHRYAFYVRLRTHTPWKVPALYGSHPATPDEATSVFEKGAYALSRSFFSKF